MLDNTQRAQAPGSALDTSALRRRLIGRVWWTRIRNLGIFALMAFGSPALTGVVRDSSLPWLVYIVAPFTGIGIFGLLATLRSSVATVIVTRCCNKTLAQYSFDAFDVTTHTTHRRFTHITSACARRGRHPSSHPPALTARRL